MFIIALFTTAKTCKQPKCPLTDGGLLCWLTCKKKNQLVIQETACNAEYMGSIHPLEKEIATHPSILSWDIP